MKIVKKESKRIEMNCACEHSEMVEEYKMHTFFTDGRDSERYECFGSVCNECFETVTIAAKKIN